MISKLEFGDFIGDDPVEEEKEEMVLLKLPKVSFVPKFCKDCIFELISVDDEPTWGSGITYDCNLKYWYVKCTWDNGVHNCPCPLDGKVKSHYDGRRD